MQGTRRPQKRPNRPGPGGEQRLPDPEPEPRLDSLGVDPSTAAHAAAWRLWWFCRGIRPRPPGSEPRRPFERIPDRSTSVCPVFGHEGAQDCPFERAFPGPRRRALHGCDPGTTLLLRAKDRLQQDDCGWVQKWRRRCPLSGFPRGLRGQARGCASRFRLWQ